MANFAPPALYNSAVASGEWRRVPKAAIVSFIILQRWNCENALAIAIRADPPRSQERRCGTGRLAMPSNRAQPSQSWSEQPTPSGTRVSSGSFAPSVLLAEAAPARNQTWPVVILFEFLQNSLRTIAPASPTGKVGPHYFNICRGIDHRPVCANRVRKSVGRRMAATSAAAQAGLTDAVLARS